MEIWLDTCDGQALAEVDVFGIIFGITTNPSLLGKVEQDPEKVINLLLDVQDGPLAVQITAVDANEIVRRALALHAFSDRIIVKVPVTRQGLIAIKQLSHQGVATMATSIFHTHQAFLAAQAGAAYVAPYVGRMLNAGIDAFEVLRAMLQIFQSYGYPTKVLAAALQSVEQLTACAEIGVPAATLKMPLFEKLVGDDPLTESSLQEFKADWDKNYYKNNSILII